MNLADALKSLPRRVPESPGTQEPARTGTEAPESASARVPEAPSAQVREYVAPREPRAVSARVPEAAGARVLERPAVEPKVGKRSDVDYRAVKVFLPIDLHEDAVYRAKKRGYKEFSALMEDLLRDWYSRT